MTQSEYVQKRRKKYLAQVMEEFERDIVPLLGSNEHAIENFKATIRRKMNALAVDAIDIFTLGKPGEVVNGAAIDLRDRLTPHGRQTTTRVRS